MKTILCFIKKELQQFMRDPRMFGIILIGPIAQVVILGYAANMDIFNIRIAVWNQDNSVTSRTYIDKYAQSGYFLVHSYVHNYRELAQRVDDGDATIGIVIPKDFEKDIRSGRGAKVQALVDGSDGNKGAIATGYAQGITGNFSQNLALENIQRMGIRTAVGNITPDIRIWYNPDLKTRNYMIPSIAALILMMTTTLMTSLAIVKEKELGTLEQLIVTPIKPWQMIVGKLVPFVMLGFIAMLLVNTVMVLWFNIPIRGGIVFYLFASLVCILSTLGLGLFISTISKTQQQAMMVSIFGVMLPMMYLSGFAFPIENMPVVIQWVTYLIPMRYFITIIRGVILKGIGFGELWKETLVLFVLGAAILYFSVKNFHKKLE